MALGDNRNGSGNGGQKKLYENTYYSRLRFKDYDNKIILGFSFQSGMLLVELSKEKDGFQYDTLITVRVTGTKARILLNQIAKFKEDIEAGTNTPAMGYGINSGMGDIVSILAFHTTEDGHKAVTLGKVDGSGKFVENYDFKFNANFHYGLEWSDISNMSVEKNYDDELEFNQFVEILEQFTSANNGAVAYSVADITRYDYKAIMNKMNPIYDKLGIERGNNAGGGSYGRGNDYFSNMNNGSADDKNSDHKSYDELEEGLPFK